MNCEKAGHFQSIVSKTSAIGINLIPQLLVFHVNHFRGCDFKMTELNLVQKLE